MNQVEIQKRADLCEKILAHNSGCPDDVSNFVQSLNVIEVGVLEREVDKGVYGLNELQDFREERKAVFDRLEASFTGGQVGLVASAEKVVEANRQLAR